MGEDVQVGLGKGKGKDRYWGRIRGILETAGGYEGIMGMARSSCSAPFLACPLLSYFTLRVHTTFLISSGNSSVQITGYTGKHLL